jgi:EAL domain-containing protein (putative c-di-GMP-specific phosphodiesterase class I)
LRRLAVDDFGTGYSSLSYLQQFPIDVLKIDQSFVHQISGDPNDSAIVSAIIDMGRNLKKRVIAAGIETQNQLKFLKARHCRRTRLSVQPSLGRRTICRSALRGHS